MLSWSHTSFPYLSCPKLHFSPSSRFQFPVFVTPNFSPHSSWPWTYVPSLFVAHASASSLHGPRLQSSVFVTQTSVCHLCCPILQFPVFIAPDFSPGPVIVVLDLSTFYLCDTRLQSAVRVAQNSVSNICGSRFQSLVFMALDFSPLSLHGHIFQSPNFVALESSPQSQYYVLQTSVPGVFGDP